MDALVSPARLALGRPVCYHDCVQVPPWLSRDRLAVVAALATFLPCYLFTIIPAPYFRKHGRKPAIVAFVDGCTAAAIGTIAGAVVVLGKRSIIDVPTALVMVVTVVLLWKVKKIPEPAIVALAAVVGLVVYPLVKC